MNLLFYTNIDLLTQNPKYIIRHILCVCLEAIFENSTFQFVIHTIEQLPRRISLFFNIPTASKIKKQ